MNVLKCFRFVFVVMLPLFSSPWAEAGKATFHGVTVGYDQGPVPAPLNLQLNKAKPVLTEAGTKQNKINKAIITNGTGYLLLCKSLGCSSSVTDEIQSQMEAARLGLK